MAKDTLKKKISYITVIWSCLGYFSSMSRAVFLLESRLQESLSQVLQAKVVCTKNCQTVEAQVFCHQLQNERAVENHHAGISRKSGFGFQTYPHGKRPQEYQRCSRIVNSTAQPGLGFCCMECVEVVQQYEQKKLIHFMERIISLFQLQILNDFRLILKIFSVVTKDGIRSQNSQVCVYKHTCMHALSCSAS